MNERPIKELKPQPGPQEQFLRSTVDIAIYGGAAGGGKSWALLYEPSIHFNNPGFGGVVFRRTSTQIRATGSLWDRSMELYPYLGGIPSESKLLWRFKSGSTIKLSHLQYESDRLNWDGSQVPYFGFDELIHFTRPQFFYMLSRNRSMCGVKPYIRAATNPDAESWVAEFIAWWIDQRTGYAIPERAGVRRWFYYFDDVTWYNSKQEAIEKHPEEAERGNFPKSVTYIPANIYDNPRLMEADPGYLSSLYALPPVERERLLNSNWKILASDGHMFKRKDFKIIEHKPTRGIVATVRSWDKAATEESGGPETAGVKMSITDEKQIIVEDCISGYFSTDEREKTIKATAEMDGRRVTIILEQEPGSGGKDSANWTVSNLIGYACYANPKRKDKVSAATPFSAYTESGKVALVRGEWNEKFIRMLVAFPNNKLKDIADAASQGFNWLSRSASSVIVPARVGRR